MKRKIPITPREVAESITPDVFQKILKEYELPSEADSISYHRLYGGIRNAVFLIKTSEGKYVLTIYKPSPTAKGRVERNLLLYNYLRPKGFFVPEVIRTKKDNLYLRSFILGAERFISCHRYIGGRKIFPYGKPEIALVGKMLAKLHHKLPEFPRTEILRTAPLEFSMGAKKTVLHMDFARGNILFSDDNHISAVLDFEGAAWGYPIIDIAKSLAIISKDNQELPRGEIKDTFIEQYLSVAKNITGMEQLDNLISDFQEEIV